MDGQLQRYRQHLHADQRDGGHQRDSAVCASVGAGRTLEISLDLADALFDAGYTLHVDAAVEDMRDSPDEVSVPLTTAGAKTPVRGRRYVSSLAYAF